MLYLYTDLNNSSKEYQLFTRLEQLKNKYGIDSLYKYISKELDINSDLYRHMHNLMITYGINEVELTLDIIEGT